MLETSPVYADPGVGGTWYKCDDQNFTKTSMSGNSNTEYLSLYESALINNMNLDTSKLNAVLMESALKSPRSETVTIWLRRAGWGASGGYLVS